MGSSGSTPTPKTCEVQAWDYPNGYGSHITFKLASGNTYLRFDNLGDWNWNDDLQSIELRGPSNCWMRVCEHSHLRGRCLKFNGPTNRSFPWGSQLSNTMSSLEFGQRSGRRREGLEKLQDSMDLEDSMDIEDFEDMIAIKPSKANGICTAMYEELLLDGELSVEKLASECQDAFDDQDAIDLCTFNVYAGAELFDSDELMGALAMPEQDENSKTELEHCKAIAEGIFELASAGQLAGVDVKLDGNDEPYYQLQQPVNETDGAATFGAMVALIVGKPIVKIAMSIIS